MSDQFFLYMGLDLGSYPVVRGGDKTLINWVVFQKVNYYQLRASEHKKRKKKKKQLT